MEIEKVGKKQLISFDEINLQKPKFSQLDKVTVLMTESQKNFIDSMAKIVMKNRITNKNSERITANTIIRSILEVLQDKDIHAFLSNIHSEKELVKSFEELFK